MTMATQPANLAGLLAAPDVTGKPSPDAAGFPARPAGPSEAVSGSDRRRRPGLRSSTRGDVYRDPTTSVVGLALALRSPRCTSVPRVGACLLVVCRQMGIR